MGVVSQTILAGYLDCKSLAQKWQNIRDSFFHKHEGKIIKSVGDGKIVLSDDTEVILGGDSNVDFVDRDSIRGGYFAKNIADYTELNTKIPADKRKSEMLVKIADQLYYYNATDLTDDEFEKPANWKAIKVAVVNNLTSSASQQAASANMVKVLNEKIEAEQLETLEITVDTVLDPIIHNNKILNIKGNITITIPNVSGFTKKFNCLITTLGGYTALIDTTTNGGSGIVDHPEANNQFNLEEYQTLSVTFLEGTENKLIFR